MKATTLATAFTAFLFSVAQTSAEQFDHFTYSVSEDTITITDYPETEAGAVTIPTEIDGKVVTAIGFHAFSGCGALTRIKIPDSVTRIGGGAFSGCSGLQEIRIPSAVTSLGSFGYPEDDAFRGCSSLESIVVDPANPNFASHDGVLFSADKTLLIRCPEAKQGKLIIPESVTSILSAYGDDGFGFHFYGAFHYCRNLTAVVIPEGVTSIGTTTFQSCSSLTHVTLPSSITSIGYSAFGACTTLKAVTFLGDPPASFGFGGGHAFGNVFDTTVPDFTIHYLSGGAGFTSPTWNDYPTKKIDQQAYPAAPWLTRHAFPYDTDLNQDINHDGVPLLLAYALDLAPHQNPTNRLPVPTLSENALSLTFHAAAPGITYTVESSTDLVHWTPEGVTLSPLDQQNQRTASVPNKAAQRFLRLVVE